MKKIIVGVSVFLFIFFQIIPPGYTAVKGKKIFSLEGLGNIYLSEEAKELLRERERNDEIFLNRQETEKTEKKPGKQEAKV